MTATAAAPTASTAAPQAQPGDRSLVVTLGRLVPIEGSEDDTIMLAAAGAPVGTEDAADLAMLQTAAGMNDLRQLAQVSVTPATPQTRFSVADVRIPDGRVLRIVRGDVDAVLIEINAGDAVFDLTRRAAAQVRKERWRPLTVAAAYLEADGNPAGWKVVGLVPLRAKLGKPHYSDAATDWVYVKLWDPALRFMHWIAVGCIVTLIGTGYMIATPFLAPGTGAPQPYLMGYIRLIHFIAAGILIATAVVRIADLWLSPYPYARWRSLWPIQNKAEAKATLEVVKGYLFFRTHRNPTWIGLNPLQALAYTAIYGLALIMVVTGLALFGLYNPSQWPYSWFQWLNQWLGSDMVRTIHYIGMWLFLVFIPAHIYLSVRSDTVDRGGAISSMFNGGVWVRKSAPVVDADHYLDKPVKTVIPAPASGAARPTSAREINP